MTELLNVAGTVFTSIGFPRLPAGADSGCKENEFSEFLLPILSLLKSVLLKDQHKCLLQPVP
jgi:hypothetical protein